MTLTQWIVIVIALIIAIVDVILYLFKGNEFTISRTLLKAAQQWPIIAVIFGILIGHLFWSNCGVCQ